MITNKSIHSIDDIDFIHVPKCAGSTLLTHFKTLDYDRFIKKDHQVAVQMRVEQGYDEYYRKFIFGVVRNPYERFISLWKYDLKVNLVNRIHTDSKKWELYYDFNEWFTKRYTLVYKNINIIPQYYWLHDWCGEKLVDHIWKMEDFPECIEFINLKLGTSFDAGHRTNKAQGGIDFTYKNITTHAVKQSLIDTCRVDCINFGYEW